MKKGKRETGREKQRKWLGQAWNVTPNPAAKGLTHPGIPAHAARGLLDSEVRRLHVPGAEFHRRFGPSCPSGVCRPFPVPPLNSPGQVTLTA